MDGDMGNSPSPHGPRQAHSDCSIMQKEGIHRGRTIKALKGAMPDHLGLAMAILARQLLQREPGCGPLVEPGPSQAREAMTKSPLRKILTARGMPPLRRSCLLEVDQSRSKAVGVH
jgi:hypothetical protein